MKSLFACFWVVIIIAVVIWLVVTITSEGITPIESFRRPHCTNLCIMGWKQQRTAYLGLSREVLSPRVFCWKQCINNPVSQNVIPPGHERRQADCPNLWTPVYNQNTAEWACRSPVV